MLFFTYPVTSAVESNGADIEDVSRALKVEPGISWLTSKSISDGIGSVPRKFETLPLDITSPPELYSYLSGVVLVNLSSVSDFTDPLYGSKSLKVTVSGD